MKKIIIVLFIFILSGCGVQDKIDKLEKTGYIKKELSSGATLYTKMDVGGDNEGQLVVGFDQEKELIALGAQLNKNDKVLSITQEKNGAKNCIVLEKDNEIKNGKIVDCDEAYQYGLEENPTLIQTFEKNIKKFNASNVPYEAKTSEGLKNILDKSVIIDNLVFEKAENQPEYDEKLGSLNTFLKNMVLSFDIVNTSKTAEISIEKALDNYGLCNITDQNDIKCDNLLKEKDIEKYKEEMLKPNEKKTIIFEKKTIDLDPKYQLGILNNDSSS